MLARYNRFIASGMALMHSRPARAESQDDMTSQTRDLMYGTPAEQAARAEREAQTIAARARIALDAAGSVLDRACARDHGGSARLFPAQRDYYQCDGCGTSYHVTEVAEGGARHGQDGVVGGAR